MPELERGGGNPVDTIFGTTTVTVSAATTVTLDTSISDNFRVVLQASGATLAFGAVTYPNNAFTDGTEVVLSLVQDATGSRTVAAFPTSLRFTGGTTPTLTTTPNRVDYFRFKYVAASGLFEQMSFLQTSLWFEAVILGEGVFARRSAPEPEPVVVPEAAPIPLAPVAQVPDDDGALTAAIDRLSTMLVTAPTPDVQVIAPPLDVDRLSASLVTALSPLLQRDDTPLVSTLSALADKLEKVSRKVSGGGGGGGGPTRLLGPDGNYYSATSPLPVSVQGAQASSVTVSNFPATQPVSGSVAVSNFPATQPVSGTVSVANVPQNGVWSYAGGTSGTRAVTGRVLDINAHSTSGGTLVINGGDTIPIPANTAFTFTPNGNLTSPTLVFTGTDSYAVEIVS